MVPRKRLPIIVEIAMIDLVEVGLPIFMDFRSTHPNHSREVCFQETIDELRRRYKAVETETRRSSGS
jgi:hypothetical protein